MANVKFQREEFEEHIKLTPEVIEKISLFGTPLESINDKEIEIEIFPNRPDLLSMNNYIRSFKSFLGKSEGLKEYKINNPEKNYNVTIDPSLKQIRPYTVCAVVKNLKLNNKIIDSLIDLQEKLHNTLGRNRKKVAIGIYPLEKIKMPIKYTALSPDKIIFRPLEAEKEMTASQILQNHQKGKKYAHLLEGFDKYPVFIDSGNKILSMPPIINSEETGKVVEETKSVFIECSGTDYPILSKTLNIIVAALSEMGGEIYKMNLFYGKDKKTTPDLEPEKLKFSIENANKLLGLQLKEKEIANLLAKMEYEYKKGVVSIPSWRIDVMHEVDIIEDIAIAYGYDKLIPEMPNIATTGSESAESKMQSKISEILIGLGLMEISTYHLIKQEEIKKYKSKNQIELINSKTDYKYPRQNLMIPTLRILSENKDSEYPQKLFEIGKVFSKDGKRNSETGINERNNLMIAVSPGKFTEVKQIIDYISKMLGLVFNLSESINPNLIEGRTADISIKNKNIGYLGDVNPKTLQAFGINMPVSIIEISLEEITKLFGSN